jgi:CheY-like chemotaxis protein
MMPKMNGIETTKRLRDMGYNQPIVALTASAVAGQAEMFLQNGFDDFISKPMDLRQVNFVLNKLIRDKQTLEVIEAARQMAIKQKEQTNHQEPAWYDDIQVDQSLANQKIDGLDIKKGLERYDGDEKTYLAILRSYARSTRTTLGLIETVTEDEITNYGIRVHGIKGASNDISAVKIGKEAEMLEKAANDGDISLIQERNPAFLEATEKLLDDIEELLLVIENDSSKPKKDKPDNELLSKLLTACDDSDMENADAVLAEIEKYQYTADDGLAHWLHYNINIANFQIIVERLSGYLGK